MNYLIARKKRTINTYFNIISSNGDFYAIPEDLDPPKQFDNNHTLDEDDWFGIQNFSQTQYCIPLLSDNFNSAENNQIGNFEYRYIKFFCAYQSDNYFCFQKFATSSLISRKWFNLTGEPELKSDQPIFIIKEIPDAIYVKDKDTLYFKRLSDIKPFFPHIDNLYNEATDAQTAEFLGLSIIRLVDEYDASKVKTANRKRIAMAMATLGRLTDQEKINIRNYIKEYCPDINFNEADVSFDVGNEEQLKKLIYGIEQRFYTTTIGDERRVANSVSRLD